MAGARRRQRDPLVTARWVSQLADALGCDRDALLPRAHDAGLPVEALDAIEWSAPLSVFTRFLAEVAREHGVEDLGLRLVARMPVGAYSVVEFIARAQPILRTGLEVIARFAALVNPEAEYRYEDVPGGGGRFIHRVDEVPAAFGPIWNEYTIAFVLDRAQAGVGVKLAPVRVWLAHTSGRDAERLRARLGAPVEHGVGFNGFELDAATLALPIRTADVALGRYLESQAAQALGAVGSRTADLVAEQLRAAFPRAPAIGEVARAVSLSPRSLQRKLGEEQTSFQEVRDRVRHERALILLAQPKLSISEVAFFIGYSTLRSFERSFHKAQGCTPSEWRKRPPG
jgi:AraC-like DNA-binding protein